MTAREPSAVEVLTVALLSEGGAPGSSLHSWRCEYPETYGRCDCVPQTAEELLTALKAAGFVVATRDEIQSERLDAARKALWDVASHVQSRLIEVQP